MKIGAYGETWLDIHMDPESAVRAHRRPRRRASCCRCTGRTFDLSYHAWEEPIVRTLKAAATRGVTVATPRIGDTVDLARPVPNTAWYARQGQP